MIRVAVAVTEVGPAAAAGDFFTALELGTALTERFGWQVEYRPREAWYDLRGVQLLLVLLPDYELGKIQGAESDLVRLGWARNWFEAWGTLPWLKEYDRVLASSVAGLRFLSEQSGRLGTLFRIATNPDRFGLARQRSSPKWEVVFTGSFWGTRRDIIPSMLALQGSCRFGLFGKNWEQVSEVAGWHQGFLPYAELPELYQQSLLVIDDANHVTKTWGAANSRVFDALAAGCLVISNSQSVSEEVFGGKLPVYRDPLHLKQLVTHFLHSAQDRETLVSHLRQKVLKEHTYAHRAWQLEFVLKQLKPEWF